MSEKDKEPIHFANPESGPRLGIFSRLGIDANVMPSGRPSLAEVHRVNRSIHSCRWYSSKFIAREMETT